MRQLAHIRIPGAGLLRKQTLHSPSATARLFTLCAASFALLIGFSAAGGAFHSSIGRRVKAAFSAKTCFPYEQGAAFEPHLIPYIASCLNGLIL